MTTPEVKAAVERVTAWLNARSFHSDYSQPDIMIGDVRALSAALAASEARRGELEGEVRKHSLAIYAVTVQLNNFRIPMKSRVLNALEAIAALNSHQEGSRDHG